MRIRQVLVVALHLCLPLSLLAQTTPGDSLPVAPTAQPGIVIPQPATTPAPPAAERSPRPERNGVYAPGGYGPSALLNSGHFGLKVGVQLTSAPITGVSPSIEKRDLDFHLGAIYRYRFYKFVIQPEVLYQIKGGNYQQLQLGSANRTTIENNFNYLSVPVMLGYIPTEGLTIQAGPEFSWRVPTTNGPQSARDLGIAVGIHYDFLDLLDKFSLNVRYVYGLTRIPETANSTLQNRTLQVGFVYNFYKK